MAMLMALATSFKRVDAHQHFWRYTDAEFSWINDAMAVIRRDFLPSHLKPWLDDTGIDATVAVQARQSLEETEWLLSLAAESSWIEGVVGWVPLIERDAEASLERLSSNSRLKGVRHVLQAEPDGYMERADFNAGLRLLRKFALTYDLLVLEHQLPVAIALVDRHPDQPIVLDHLAKPRIAAHALEPWRSNIRELARRPHVCCKLSGMVTETDFTAWTADDLLPYIETVLEAFGPARLMFGSDWPVCTVASTYRRWVDTVVRFIETLSQNEQDQIMGLNAARFYELPHAEEHRVS
jgi:L-fuconolactonase